MSVAVPIDTSTEAVAAAARQHEDAAGYLVGLPVSVWALRVALVRNGVSARAQTETLPPPARQLRY